MSKFAIMKTILIIVAGMADLPDPRTLKDTPLLAGQLPNLDILARRGHLSSIPTLKENEETSHINALMSLLGYDLSRGIPKAEELMSFGLDNSSRLTDYESLRPFIIPGFSGHGVTITPSAWVRGAGKCAFLHPLDIYSPGSSDEDILATIARLTTESVAKEEFILVYVDSPLKASLRGDYDGKVKALEQIDRSLIAPIADFVWKSDLMINLAVTTDLVTPWHRRRPNNIAVPVVVYFNNDDIEGEPEKGFTEVDSLLMHRYFDQPSSLIRYLSNFRIDEGEDGFDDLPQ